MIIKPVIELACAVHAKKYWSSGSLLAGELTLLLSSGTRNNVIKYLLKILAKFTHAKFNTNITNLHNQTNESINVINKKSLSGKYSKMYSGRNIQNKIKLKFSG